MKKKVFKIFFIFVISIFFFPANIKSSCAEDPENIKDFWKLWAIDNDGSFYLEQYFDGEWRVTSNNSLKGIDINFNNSLNGYTTKRNVIIAVIDTGVHYKINAIKDQIWKNSDEISNDKLDNDNNGYVDDTYGWNFLSSNNNIEEGSQSSLAHGTQIVGTLCSDPDKSIINGIVSDINSINIMCLKILDDTLTGSTNDLIKAIKYAEKNGAKICCLSLRNDYDEKLFKTIKKSSMLFIVAAGNQSLDLDINDIYPASYNCKNIITVANLKSDGTLNETSNYGRNQVDIAAPGTDILGIIDNDMYIYSTGTSFAVPYVAGTAALIYSKSKTMTIYDVKRSILKSAKKLKSLNNLLATEGILDIKNTLNNN